MNLALRNVTLFTGERCDLFIAGTRLVDEAPPGASVVDASGLIALPGLVDPHTHLREPGGIGESDPAETIASGTAAAARGGYTAVAAMPNTIPACNGVAEVHWLLNRARSTGAAARVVPVGAVTYDRAGHRLADLNGLAKAGVRLYSDDGAAVATEALLRAALLTISRYHGAVADHCQDPALAGPAAWRPDCLGPAETPDEAWPAEAETAIVRRDVQVAEQTGGHVHLCHLSCAESVEIVRWAKTRGVHVTAEVTPHHLFLTSDRLLDGTPAGQAGNAAFKVNPPLRTAEDAEALRAGLVDGTIDMIGTDHAPHRGADKAKPMPLASPGLTGLEQALGVVTETMVNTGRLNWADIARLMSQAPAQLLHLRNQGRNFQRDSPATLTLIDPTRRLVVRADDTASLARNNPYAGLDLPVPVVMTFWTGRRTY